MKINIKLVSLKAFFFCNYAAAGALLPFLTVHLKNIGITSTEAGVIAGLTQLLSLFLRPVCGAIADKHHKHKTILLIMLLLYASSFFSLMLVPYRQRRQNITCILYDNGTDNVTCSQLNENHSTFSNYCLDIFGRSRVLSDDFVICDDADPGSVELTCGLSTTSQDPADSVRMVNEKSPYAGELFKEKRNITINCTLMNSVFERNEWSFDLTSILSFVLVLVGRTSYSSLQSLLDTITYFMLGTNRLQYSRQRLWGTAGTAISSSCVIFIIDAYYGGVFYLFAVFCLLAFLVGLTLKVQPGVKEKVKLLGILKGQIALPHVKWFLVKVLFFGLLLGTLVNFLFWFFRDIGVSGSFLGIVTLIHCVSSLVVQQITPRLLKTYGQDKCLYGALCVYCIRFAGHSFVYNQWIIIPLELLRGISYALFWAAASSKVSLLAPPGSQGTCQGITGAIYNDLGRGSGSILTGVLFAHFDARWTFRGYSVFCVILLLFSLIFDRNWKTPVNTTKESEMKALPETNDQLRTEKHPESKTTEEKLLPEQSADVHV